MELSSFLPYPSIPQANGTDVQFTTAKGVTYEASFTQADDYFPGFSFAPDALEFSIFSAEPESIVGFDARIGLTISNIIAGRFQQNPRAVVCYVCDQTDARAFKRAIRFARLFEQGNAEGDMAKIDFEQPPLYATILFRRNHPARAEIEQAALKLAGKLSDEEE